MSSPLWLAVALTLLVAGVVGSVVPLVPGPLLSVAGVLVYWWSTGYADPGAAFVAGVLLVGVGAVLVDWFAGAVATAASGATTAATVAAAVVGVLGFLVAGPLGILVGAAVTVFAVELLVTRDAGQGLRASLYATAGLPASAAVQALVAASVLLGFLVAVAV
jgi:uncharacterized protein YqgC (DUF456 family)